MEKKLTVKINSMSKYFLLWNGIFKLTDMELKVLVALVQTDTDDDFCGAENKKEAAKIVGIKDFNTLNNYVKKFKDKGAITKKGKIYSLNPLLVGEPKRITINLNWNE